MADHPLTDRVRVRAAGMWLDERGLVSGPAAAFWHGLLPRAPLVVGVTVPRSGVGRGPSGIRIRRRDLDPADVCVARGIRTTALPLTVLATAAVLPEGSVFLDRALQRHTEFAQVYAAYCRGLGAHGSRRAGELLVAAADRADSVAERRLHLLLRDAGLVGWTAAYPIGRWTLDVAFRAARVAVEVDGWAWHVDVERFRADRRKGNALVAQGWVLLRFTWHDLVHRQAHVVGEIRA